MKVFRYFGWLLALAVLLFFAASMEACEFCMGEKGMTLTLQFEDADMVLYGHFENPRIGGGELGSGEADFILEEVLKTHDAVKGVKKLTLPKRITNPSLKFVVFAHVNKGSIDPYKGTVVSDASEMRKYIAAILKNKDKSQPERLRVAFDFLTSPESEVAMDAYQEFLRADYSDYKEMAKTLPADTIAGWLQDPKTPPWRYGLYASLLGHCGKAKHAELLLAMINDPEKRQGSGLHGMMAAYTMIEPKKGWKFLNELVQNKGQKKERFMVRYAGLQTMRFLLQNRLDVIDKDENVARAEIVKGVAGILNVGDMADFAIEDLRKWRRWEFCDQVIDLAGKENFGTPIMRKAILRYALQCPSGRAVDYVKAQRKLDREYVDDTLELLNVESPPTAPAKTDGKNGKTPPVPAKK